MRMESVPCPLHPVMSMNSGMSCLIPPVLFATQSFVISATYRCS